MRICLLLLILTFAFHLSAEDKKPVIKYEYKKYEKFDFDTIGVEGESGAPGDLSISPGLRNEFRNKLPERKNFNDVMINSINGIR